MTDKMSPGEVRNISWRAAVVVHLPGAVFVSSSGQRWVAEECRNRRKLHDAPCAHPSDMGSAGVY